MKPSGGSSMRRVSLSLLASLVLSGSLMAPTYFAAGGEPHPLIRRAVNALQAARTDLQNAAHDYCGHRVEALGATNSALEQLHQALACESKRGNSNGADIEDPASAEPAPSAEPAAGEP